MRSQVSQRESAGKGVFTQFTTHRGGKVVIRNQQYLSKHGFSLLRPGPSSQKLASVWQALIGYVIV